MGKFECFVHVLLESFCLCIPGIPARLLRRLSNLGAGSTATTAQPASSATEAAVSETDMGTNRDEQQDNQFMDVDDPLEPMVMLPPEGKVTLICRSFFEL